MFNKLRNSYISCLPFFEVSSKERANIRRFGTKVYKKPLSQGLHFKIPFIDRVDKLFVVLSTININNFDTLTSDNHRIEIGICFNYTIPDDKVNFVLYFICKNNGKDAIDRLSIFIKDKVSEEISKFNIKELISNRSILKVKLYENIKEELLDLFGISLYNIQIPEFNISNELLRSYEVAHINDINVDSDMYKLSKQLECVGGFDNFIKYLDLTAQLKWDGKKPMVYGGNSAIKISKEIFENEE